MVQYWLDLINSLCPDGYLLFNIATAGLKCASDPILAFNWCTPEDSTMHSIYHKVEEGDWERSQAIHKLPYSLLRDQGVSDLPAAIRAVVGNKNCFTYNRHFQVGFLSDILPADQIFDVCTLDKAARTRINVPYSLELETLQDLYDYLLDHVLPISFGASLKANNVQKDQVPGLSPGQSQLHALCEVFSKAVSSELVQH